MAPKKITKPETRHVISVTASVAQILVQEQARIHRDSGIHVSIAALVRKAVEEVYGR